MIGIVYAVTTAVSHVGARIKEFTYNSQAKVDPRTNTYRDYYSKTRDADTGKQLIEWIEPNGDITLYDTNHRLVRNVSADERQALWNAKRNDPGRNKETETAINTHEIRTVKIRTPGFEEASTIKGTVFKDLDNGAEYFEVKQPVDTRFHKHYGAPFYNAYFYVSTVQPYTLIRMSDRQLVFEREQKEKGDYNWIDNPHDIERFIKDYNNRPFKEDSTHDEMHIRKIRTISC